MNKYAAMGLVLLALSPLILMVLDVSCLLYRRWIKKEDVRWM